MTKEQLKWFENFCNSWAVDAQAQKDLEEFIENVSEASFTSGQYSMLPD